MRDVLRLLPLCLWLASCLGQKDDDETGSPEDTSAVRCPATVSEFCLFELGGSCPSFPDAAETLRCDGHRFAPEGPDDPRVTPEGEACEMHSITCSGEDDWRTKLWFDPNGDQLVIGVTYQWPDTEECHGGGYVPLGEVWCR